MGSSSGLWQRQWNSRVATDGNAEAESCEFAEQIVWFCLSALTAYTTNNSWQRHFYHRTVQQSLEIRKKVDSSNMSLCW